MDTNELLIEFVQRGGVVTLYQALPKDKYPIRFAIKWQGKEYNGTISHLDIILANFLDDGRYGADDGRMPIDAEDAWMMGR